MRIETGFASPKDLLGLRISLEQSPKILALLEGIDSPLLSEWANSLCDVSPLTEKSPLH